MDKIGRCTDLHHTRSRLSGILKTLLLSLRDGVWMTAPGISSHGGNDLILFLLAVAKMQLVNSPINQM